MKHLLIVLAFLVSIASAYRDSIPDAVRRVPNPVTDPVQVKLFDGTFQTTSEVTYSPVFELSKLTVYGGVNSSGVLVEDTAFGQARFMGFDISDSAAVTDSVNVQLVTQCSDYSRCENPLSCPSLSDPWYTVFTDTIKGLSAASAAVEKTRDMNALTLKTCRFIRWKATQQSTAAQNIPRIIGEWHRKKRVE
jgi:hypothetical protein